MTGRNEHDAAQVRGNWFRPRGCAFEAFSRLLDVPAVASDHPAMADDLRRHADEFITAMPGWMAQDALDTCEALAARIRTLRGTEIGS